MAALLDVCKYVLFSPFVAPGRFHLELGALFGYSFCFSHIYAFRKGCEQHRECAMHVGHLSKFSFLFVSGPERDG
jgi:hypothetical protein